MKTASGATPHSGLVSTSSPDTMRPTCGGGKQSRKSGSERTSSTGGERGPDGIAGVGGWRSSSAD